MRTTYDALEHLGVRWPRSGTLSCPAHQDKTPSLHLYQDHFYCFSCGATGDGYGLIALMTGRPVEQVLREMGGHDPQRASRATIELVGPQAMEATVRRRWSEMNRTVFGRLHEVFGDLQDSVLIDAIDRTGAILDDALMQILGFGPYTGEPPLPVREALHLIERVEARELQALDAWDLRIVGAYAVAERTVGRDALGDLGSHEKEGENHAQSDIQ